MNLDFFLYVYVCAFVFSERDEKIRSNVVEDFRERERERELTLQLGESLPVCRYSVVLRFP